MINEQNHNLQVDAVYSALKALGYKDIEIVVAETGWPYNGDSNEVGPSVENAKAYNGNLVAHLRSLVGTPLMPGKSVDTYIFALYDEDLKPGPTSERSFGLFKPDLTMAYDIGLSKSSQVIVVPLGHCGPSFWQDLLDGIGIVLYQTFDIRGVVCILLCN